jgi:hypothetical protein
MLKLHAQNPDSESVEHTSLVPAQAQPNGGFPEPWIGEPVQLVRCRHDACGGTTLVRLPRAIPTEAVRVVVCGGCQQSFEVGEIEELGVLAPATREPVAAPLGPTARATRRRIGGSPLEGRWALIAVPVALAAVIGGLLLIQGGGGSSSPAPPAPTSPAAAAATGGSAAGVNAAGASAPAPRPTASKNATLIRGSTYTLALPPGWVRSAPQGRATFAAREAAGGADASLWVRRKPSLDLQSFEAQSLARMRAFVGSANVVDRVGAPTAQDTIIRLGADSAPGQPTYDVTLRVAGPYRYYLATTLQPNPSPDAAKGVQLISNSLTPTPGGKAAK